VLERETVITYGVAEALLVEANLAEFSCRIPSIWRRNKNGGIS